MIIFVWIWVIAFNMTFTWFVFGPILRFNNFLFRKVFNVNTDKNVDLIDFYTEKYVNWVENTIIF